MQLQSAVTGPGKARERSLFSYPRQATSGVMKQPAGRVQRRHQKYAARSQALIEEFNPSRWGARDISKGKDSQLCPSMKIMIGSS